MVLGRLKNACKLAELARYFSGVKFQPFSGPVPDYPLGWAGLTVLLVFVAFTNA
jgi:hypothetical protein